MISNTVHDFLRTDDINAAGVTCPACGSILSLRKQGSFEIVLTDNARLQLDASIASWRRYLEELEFLLDRYKIQLKPLETKDYPHKNEKEFYKKNREDNTIEFGEQGIYTDIRSQRVSKILEERLDFFEWKRIYDDFPRQKEIGESQNVEGSQDLYQKVIDILIPSLEPWSIAGPIMYLIFEQKYVIRWLEEVRKNESFASSINDLLQDISPSIKWYLDQYEKHYQGPEKKSQNLEVIPTFKDGIDNNKYIERIKLILIFLLGHKRSNDSDKAAEDLKLSEIRLEKNDPFTLPRRTLVSPGNVTKLLCSEILLGAGRDIGLTEDLITYLFTRYDADNLKKSNKDKDDSSDDDSSDIENLKRLKAEIFKFIKFCCTGSPSESLNILNKEKNPIETNNKEENDGKYCDWYPKEEKTHSVILLGSPGTGKSTVMITGFTNFYNNISAMGGTITFESPADEKAMSLISDMYWKGEMPPPTSVGDRTTIKLYVDFPKNENSYARKYFVFTDIAGEIVAKSLSEDGSDPAVLRILKNVETIVFFFDFSIEPSIRKKMNESNDDTWKHIEDIYKQVTEARKIANDNNDNSQTEKSRAEISQLQLLRKLIADIRENRIKDNSRKNSDIDFITIIPKIDLFAQKSDESDEDSPDRHFMNDFFEKLIEQDILVRSSRNMDDDTYDNLQSLGGSGCRLDRSENDKDKVQKQIDISRTISDAAIECFNNIGNALPQGCAEPIKKSLAEQIKVNLVDSLQHEFGDDNVYFIPVSAKGTNNELEEGNPPNQKLSEYVFMLPVALSTKKSSSENVDSTETSSDLSKTSATK